MSELPAPQLPEKEQQPDDSNELEIKDAQLIFNQVWVELQSELGKENLRFPKEIILLGGAPGSGKGTNTRFILNARGLTCNSIVVSDLLTSPEAQAIKDRGGIVGDEEVIDIVLRELIKEEYRDGAVLDGFPRTKVQVECLKLLVNKMKELRQEYFDTDLHKHFRQPTVHIMVLFVDEKTSVDRQLSRGQEMVKANEKAVEEGDEPPYIVRKTDLDPDAAKHRYRVFKEKTWDALQSLKAQFFYHFVNAQGSFELVEKNILEELRYQSSLELEPATYDRLRSLPLAKDIVIHARQDLVRRLDSYETKNPQLFASVIDFIQERLMPIVTRHAISGLAIVNSEDRILYNSEALAMLIDVFSERGYHAVVDLHRIEIPKFFDPTSGKIACREKRVFRIQIRFKGSEIRRG